MDKEIWKGIKFHENEYQISNLGRVKSLARKNHPREEIISERLKNVTLCSSTGRTSYPIDELVAQAFVPNPNHYYRIRHKDGWRENNSADNLEWY